MADIAQTEDGSCVTGRRRCVLIEGAPGSGKSTLAWKLCRKWGKGKTLQQYRLVVLLKMREKKVRETLGKFNHGQKIDYKIAQTIEELLSCGLDNAYEIAKSGGRGIILLLDGWDELPTELREEESFFLDLLKGRVLKNATIVMTSRPRASEIIVSECKDRIFQHIQVMGFSEDNVKAYMRSSVRDDEGLLQGLQTYTSCYPHIRSIMYNPLSAAIVVEVYKNSWKEKTTIPKTMTELYSSLIRTLLLRYLKEHPIHGKRKWKLRQFNDLPPDVYHQLCLVSKKAYEGIVRQQVIFSDLPDDFDSLGLMQGVPELYVDEGTALSYNFLHLTIQEFLAALHLSQQSTEQQVEMFTLYQNTSSYKMILKFMAGLTSLEGFSEDALFSILQERNEFDEVYITYLGSIRLSKDEYIKISVDGSHFLFEGRKMNILPTQSKACFTVLWLSPIDSYILGCMLAHTVCQWKIEYNTFQGNAINATMFARGTREDEDLYPAEAGTISLHSKPDCYQELLTASASVLTRIVELSLNPGVFDGSCYFHAFHNLTQSLPSLPHLESLQLHNCIINLIPSSSSQTYSSHPFSLAPSSPVPSSTDGDERYSATCNFLSPPPRKISSPNEAHPTSFEQTFPPSFHPSVSSPPPPSTSSPGSRLIKALQSHTILKKLTLQNTRIGELECVALAEWLSSPTCSLEELDISRNRLTSQSTKLIITALYHNCTVRNFNIAGSDIPTQLLAPLLGLPLVSLDLSGCSIGRKGVCEIAGALCSNTVLEELDLSYNPIGNFGAIALADMLLHNKSLRNLNLQWSSLTTQGVCEIARALCRNAILEELNLADNEMGEIGATSVAKTVLYNRSIKILSHCTRH